MPGVPARSPNPPDFRELFESAPSPNLVFTRDFTIVAVSDAYLRATMLQREDILGRGVFEVFPENPADEAMQVENKARTSFERVIATGQPDTPGIIKYDIRRPESEGGGFEERYWSPFNVPMLDAGGKVAFVVHRVEDVTEFVKLQRASDAERERTARLQSHVSSMETEIFLRSRDLQRANHRLQDANDELRRRESDLRELSSRLEATNGELEAFSYSVSHDLRAPLRHIDGFADLLTRHAAETLDEKGRRLLGVISDSAKSMGALIDDLLEFSRSGRAEMRRDRVDLDRLVADIVRGLQMQHPERRIGWSLSPLPEVAGDLSMLRQVFTNLISNAVKYTAGREPATIEIGVTHAPGEHEIAIRDNGVGFDMKYAGKLFGVFQRLHRSDEFEGTGVGLAIVRRIVQRHGGRVWAESEPGRGATFRIALPRAEAAAVSAPLEEAA